jgi:hypothetical protein
MPHLILCSLDSLVGAFAIRFCSAGRLSRARVVAAFGLSDLLASMAGALLASSTHPLAVSVADSWPLKAAFFMIPIVVIVAADSFRKALWLLPVVFCIDNLFYGWAGYFPNVTLWLSTGLVSTLFAGFGILLASMVAPQAMRFRHAVRVALALVTALLAAI